MRNLTQEFGSGVRWMGVYIAEAHTVDEWPMPCVHGLCRHMQPTSIEQRAEHAREFVKDFQPPFDMLLDTYVDGWNDPFMKTFGAWPERFYVFQYYKPRGKQGSWMLRWWNNPDPLQGHRVDDIADWLHANARKSADSLLAPPPLLRRTTSAALREEAQLAKVREVFEAYKEEGKGTINRNQTRALLKSIGYVPEIFSRAFAEMDLDKSGSLNLIEFEALFSSIHPRLQEELRTMAQLLHVGGPVEPRSAIEEPVAAQAA